MKVNKRVGKRDINSIERNLRLVSCFTLPIAANLTYLSFTLFYDKMDVSYLFYLIALIYAIAIMLYIFINAMCLYQMAMVINPFMYPVFVEFMPNWAISTITGVIVVLGIGRFLINKSKNK